MTDKPTTAAGYRAEETAQVTAACLTLAGALGDLADEPCIVGGLVPSMICDAPVDPSALGSGAHVRTNDVDVALEVSVLDDEHYKEIASRLRGKDFAPDTKESGAIVRQRWRWRDQKVTVDFLIPPSAGTDPDKVRVPNLEHDFAAPSSSRSASRSTSSSRSCSRDTRSTAISSNAPSRSVAPRRAVRDFLDACADRGITWARRHGER